MDLRYEISWLSTIKLGDKGRHIRNPNQLEIMDFVLRSSGGLMCGGSMTLVRSSKNSVATSPGQQQGGVGDPFPTAE